MRWRCPACCETTVEADPRAEGQPLFCRHCERLIRAEETLCVVCDAPNPWHRRDTIHYLCRTCGTMQRWLAEAM